MSQQLALSSLFSVIALACLCVVSINGGIAAAPAESAGAYSVQAEIAPGLNG